LERQDCNELKSLLFSGARSLDVENASDAGEVACNKPEAQAKGIE
jgi:hypothetical protein